MSEMIYIRRCEKISVFDAINNVHTIQLEIISNIISGNICSNAKFQIR